MVSTIVIASSNLMSNVRWSKRLPVFRLVIRKNTAAIGFHGQTICVGGTTIAHHAKRRFSVFSVPPGSPPPPDHSPSSWIEWLLGIVITVIVPFFSSRWNKLLKFKDEMNTVVEETEKVIDCVEEVAETVDKVAKDVADHLPEGGTWKNAAEYVEGVAEEIAKDAHLAQDFLHEVEEVEHKVELLVESIKDQAKGVDEDHTI